MEHTHIPVLLDETVEHLHCQPNGIYLDGTLGSGGHAFKILKDNPKIRLLIGIDWDQEAIKVARTKLRSFSGKTLFFQENFTQLPAILHNEGIKEINGIVLDLGVSSASNCRGHWI